MNIRRLASVLLIWGLIVPPVSHAARKPFSVRCRDLLTAGPFKSEREALQTLSSELPKLFGSDWVQRQSWYQLLQHFALPSSYEETPLLVSSILGGGNAGKSTLMNSLPALLGGAADPSLHDSVSQTGYYPGLTRRMVIAASPWALTGSLEGDLRNRFGQLEAWTSANAATNPGPGILTAMNEIPAHLAFIDSPDFDTGEAARDNPDNLEQALKVIYPSDVLIVMLNPQTIRSQAIVKRLHEFFRNYGFKQTIIIYMADPSTPEIQANQLVLDITNSLYGTRGDRYPEAVLGAYVMPYSTAVPLGQALPKLVPLAGFPKFEDLARQMNQRSPQIKRYALTNASDTIQREVALKVREYIKGKMAAAIYAQCLTTLAEEVARSSAEDFPYVPLRPEIVRRFHQLSGGLSRLIRSFGSLLAVPERSITGLIRHTSATSEGFSALLKENSEMQDRLAVGEFLLQMQKGVLTFNTLDPPSSLGGLSNLVTRYYAMFPEERPSDAPSPTPSPATSQLRIMLPRSDLLSLNAQVALGKMLDADRKELTQNLGKQLSSAQLDTKISPQAEQEIYRALAQIKKDQSTGRRFRSALLNGMTVAAPAAASYFLFNHNVNVTLIYLAAINLTARPFKMWSEASEDNFLKAALNRWFKNLQYKITKGFFDSSVTDPLTQALTAQQTEQEAALANVQRALLYLNSNYEPLLGPSGASPEPATSTALLPKK